MRIVAAIARHGALERPKGVPSAQLLYPLTSQGREQAASLAQRLLAYSDQHALTLHPVIDASPLLSAFETATIVAEALSRATHRPFRVDQHDVLCARSFGPAANLTIAEIEDLLAGDARCGRPPPGWRHFPEFALPFPGAESLRDAGQRVAEHLRASAARLATKSRASKLQLFVSHSCALRYASVELGVLDAARAGNLGMHHCEPILLEAQPSGSWQHLDGASAALSSRK
jgi:2,3-bisphosphoglycerate-dependent phosphoglycerate mutase